MTVDVAMRSKWIQSFARLGESRIMLSSIRSFRAFGGIRNCLFSFVIVPLCFLFLVVALFDFSYNGLSLEHGQPKEIRFRQSFKSHFDSSNNDSEMSSLSNESYRAKVMEVINLARRITVDKNCHSQTIRKQHFNLQGPARFYADNRHKLLYCYIPKVASTNIKRLMLLLSGTVAKENFTSLTRELIHYKNPMSKVQPRNEEELVQQGFGNYIKFMFVRHPFQRLVSAYYNKFSSSNSSEDRDLELPDKINQNRIPHFPLEIGTEIIRKYRTNPSNRSLQEGNDVTVSEFVNYVIDEWIAKRELNVHWKSMVDICLPCSVKYDFIGKLETIEKDIDFLLHNLEEDEFRQYFKKTTPSSTNHLVKQFMDQLTPRQLSDLARVYEQDFKVFGYEPNVYNAHF